MKIIKLDAIDSTNSYLKTLSTQKNLDDYTVVIAKMQTNGKGQMGSKWESPSGKNLTFSVFKQFSSVYIEYPFVISMLVSLAIINTLEKFQIPKLFIKWPNDILSDNKKICGILIENLIKSKIIDATIIGVGLNVNQTNFENLPKGSSLKNLTGNFYDLNELLFSVIQNIKNRLVHIGNHEYTDIKETYENYLFRKDKPSTFKTKTGTLFMGYIKGVNYDGTLNVLIEDNVVESYDLKAIELLY